MTDKPVGPIWVDMAPALANDLTVTQLVRVANLALNRLTLRDAAEVFFDAGLKVEVQMKETSHD